MRRTAWFIGLFLVAAPALAAAPAERTLFDSWNAGLCEATDTATLDIYAPSHVSRIEVLFHWDQGEAQVAYTLLKPDGSTAIAGSLTRSQGCDPAAPGLCGATATPGLDLPAGAYKVRAARQAICRNADSEGSGFVRAFGWTAGS